MTGTILGAILCATVFLIWLAILITDPSQTKDKAITVIKATTEPQDGKNYRATATLLSEAERLFFNTLADVAQALDLGMAIKVRVADLIEPVNTYNNNKKSWWQRFRFISQKHVDFVLLDLTYRPVIAIELNDRSHDNPVRQTRDRDLRAAFTDASIPLLFVEASNRYSYFRLKEAIMLELKHFGIVASPVKPEEAQTPT